MEHTYHRMHIHTHHRKQTHTDTHAPSVPFTNTKNTYQRWTRAHICLHQTALSPPCTGDTEHTPHLPHPPPPTHTHVHPQTPQARISRCLRELHRLHSLTAAFSVLTLSFLEMYEYQPEAVEMPLLQDVRQQHRASPCPRPCFHFHLADEPCTPATHRRKQRAMKVFYMRVRRKRGGNVVWDSQEGLVPPRKRTKVEEIAFPGTMPAQPNLSYQSTEDLVTEDSSCFMGEQEQVQEAASYQAAPPAEEGMPQAQASTPEWQLSPRRGFKCMACCRVFSSLADLQEHVQHGAKEGFSCRVFHLAFAWLESKKHMLEKRDNKKTARKTSGRKKEKHLDAGKSPRQ
uniref:Family with sequence similarity 170 member A n=1 Tax=Oryctolagus cuniculus TaxID=9986 RepID=U3KMC0_RABIT